MIASICEAISRTKENGLIVNKAYYLFVKTAPTGEVSIKTIAECNIEIIYGNIHDFLKDWQSISAHGYAKNESDLKDLFAEIKGR